MEVRLRRWWKRMEKAHKTIREEDPNQSWAQMWSASTRLLVTPH